MGGKKADIKQPELKEVWQVEMEIYLEVKRICDKLGIKIFADSGTLLGAVRHHGFIPWDNDMDFTMMRGDYDKFVAEGPALMPKEFEIQVPNSGNEIVRANMQVRKKGTAAILKKEIKYGCRDFNQGIFIDIFPLDILSKYELVNDIFSYSIRSNWRKFMIKKSFYDDSTGMKLGIKKALSKVLAHKPSFYYNKATRLVQKIPFKGDSVDSILYYSISKRRHHFSRKDFAKAIPMKFENIEMEVPVGYDDILRQYYGSDYMTPKNSGDSHGDIIFSTNTDYRKIIDKIMGEKND